MSRDTWACPRHPFGHEWVTDPLRCSGCGTTRTAADAITSLVASVRGRDEKTACRLLDAFRADLLAEYREADEAAQFDRNRKAAALRATEADAP